MTILRARARLITAAITLCALSALTHAEPLYTPEAGVTTGGKIELIYQAVHLADWMQTLTIAKNPDRFYETNKILGEHPSAHEVNQYFLATAIGHALVSHFLPAKPSRIWQGATIVMQVGYVTQNRQLGIGLNVEY